MRHPGERRGTGSDRVHTQQGTRRRRPPTGAALAAPSSRAEELGLDPGHALIQPTVLLAGQVANVLETDRDFPKPPAQIGESGVHLVFESAEAVFESAEAAVGLAGFGADATQLLEHVVEQPERRFVLAVAFSTRHGPYRTRLYVNTGRRRPASSQRLGKPRAGALASRRPMAEIQPFRALRYASAKVSDLSRVIAPPYDVISPEQREALAARDPHNVVHLILPKERDGLTRYQVAARALESWVGDGTLGRDTKPALYVMAEEFEHGGQRHVRRGVQVRLRLHEFSEGVVLPHEKTLSGPKADRLDLIKEVRANLSPIFGLVPDDDGRTQALLAGLTSHAPDAEGRSDDGVVHRLYVVNDPEAIASVQTAMAAQRVYIADGHHRYETALDYRDRLDASGKAPDRGSHKYVLAYLCPMTDPGLVILPTHRVLFGLKATLDASDRRAALEEFFTRHPAAENLSDPQGLASALNRLQVSGGAGPAFLIAVPHRALSTILRLKPGVDLSRVEGMPNSPVLRSLDVPVLHGVVFQRVLGLTPESQERQENLRYVKDASEVVRLLASGECQVGVFLNPTRMAQVRSVAECGEAMPQKSTFFYPKLPSGMVMNPIDPRELAV